MDGFSSNFSGMMDGPYIPNYRPRPPGLVDHRFQQRYNGEAFPNRFDFCVPHPYGPPANHQRVPNSKFHAGRDWQFLPEPHRGRGRGGYRGSNERSANPHRNQQNFVNPPHDQNKRKPTQAVCIIPMRSVSL